MPRITRTGTTGAALLAAGVLLLASAPAAQADDGGPDPLGQVQQLVNDTTSQVAGPVGADGSGATGSASQDGGGSATASQDAPDASPAADDDSDGHETPNPQSPDHGKATVGHIEGGDQDVTTIGSNKATTRDDDSTSADSTALALGGQEVLGAHADSHGTKESHTGDPLAPVCDSSSGQVCLELLYADASAHDSNGRSTSSSDSGLARACMGGSDPSGDACEGPVSTGVATSGASSSRNQSSGRTRADSHSSVASACLQHDASTGTCTIGANALESQGHADSDGSAKRSSRVVALQLGSQSVDDSGKPQALSVPPECPSPSVACLFLNQGETYTGGQLSGTAQQALHAGLLDNNLIAHLATSETLAHNDGGEQTSGPGGPGGSGNEAGQPGVGAVSPPSQGALSPSGGLLPNTGGVWVGLLGLGLSGLGGGILMLAWRRRLLVA